MIVNILERVLKAPKTGSERPSAAWLKTRFILPLCPIKVQRWVFRVRLEQLEVFICDGAYIGGELAAHAPELR